jgi:uncharacterized membrane protein
MILWHTADMSTTRERDMASDRRALLVLAASIALTIILYVVPVLRSLAWPLLLISTLAHELGHGLAAVAVGGDFEALMMWSDGSGVATWSALVGRFGHAAIAAGGLVGPAFAAAACLLAGRTERGARIALWVMGIGLVLADTLVVRNLFGAVFVAVLAVIFMVLASIKQGWVPQLGLVLIAVQLALSVFSRGDYLFTREAVTATGSMPSDVAQISKALVLPYWFWGACCGLISVAVLVLALVAYFPRLPSDSSSA